MRTKALLLAMTVGAAATAQAGVKSLTSEQMVDTYMKDSAIIVVPKQRQQTAEEKAERERQKATARTLVISPGEPVTTEAEEEAQRRNLQEEREEQLEFARLLTEEERQRASLLRPEAQIAALQPEPEFSPLVPPVIFGQQLEIPEGAFNQTFFNNQLGLNFDGQTVEFQIGTPPGIDRINVPQSINEGPVRLTPRPGGGFNLAIDVPQD